MTRIIAAFILVSVMFVAFASTASAFSTNITASQMQKIEQFKKTGKIEHKTPTFTKPCLVKAPKRIVSNATTKNTNNNTDIRINGVKY